jgi:hypothetical protein
VINSRDNYLDARRDLDDVFCEQLPAKYFRYVDDIALVGDSDSVEQSLTLVRSRLADVGFTLHGDDSPKTFRTPARKWIEARDDFKGGRGPVSWMTLIGDLKRFLLMHPESREELQRVFRQEDFRVPVHDYTGTVHEASAAERILALAKRRWFRRKSQQITIESILDQAKYLRGAYTRGFLRLAEGAETLTEFDRKRRIPRPSPKEPSKA